MRLSQFCFKFIVLWSKLNTMVTIKNYLIGWKAVKMRKKEVMPRLGFEPRAPWFGFSKNIFFSFDDTNFLDLTIFSFKKILSMFKQKFLITHNTIINKMSTNVSWLEKWKKNNNYSKKEGEGLRAFFPGPALIIKIFFCFF